MDHVFLESREGGWAICVTDADGKTIHEKSGEQAAEMSTSLLAKCSEKRVFVVWQQEGIRVPPGFYGKRAVVDLYQIAWVLVAGGALEDRTLESLARWCSVSYSDKTHADRVRVTRECYFRVVERARVGLQIEDVGRTLASAAAEKLTRFVGKLAT